MTPQDALVTLRRVLDAWRQDPVFRYVTIGLGITAVLLLLRLAGPDAPELRGPARVLPLERSGVTGPGVPPHTPKPNEPEIPKIAPGQNLDAVTVAPTVDGDRFGTFKPGPRP